ncbi:hypothetical protein ASZ90_001739 [hydrocarbon metagenome]|uniref:Uncharacterized protein n=1 Tax=hydrocarbon metagenome TaxID=938273 RepID=A0A0W8G5F8_9ZZZZ
MQGLRPPDDEFIHVSGGSFACRFVAGCRAPGCISISRPCPGGKGPGKPGRRPRCRVGGRVAGQG